MKQELIANTTTFNNVNNLKATSFNYELTNQIKIKTGKHGLPRKQTSGSAGYDLRADLIENIKINPGETFLVNVGISLEMPEGTCAMILPRSGLALKKGITVPNAPGLIDSDYRGDVCVILHNGGTEPFYVEDGDRIAQIIFTNFISPSFISVDELGYSDRSRGGFGSTGI